MTAALIAVAAGWAVTVSALIRMVVSQQRAHARREDLLINQLLHAAGRTWQPAPAAPASEMPEPEWEPPALVDPAQLAV